MHFGYWTGRLWCLANNPLDVSVWCFCQVAVLLSCAVCNSRSIVSDVCFHLLSYANRMSFHYQRTDNARSRRRYWGIIARARIFSNKTNVEPDWPIIRRQPMNGWMAGTSKASNGRYLTNNADNKSKQKFPRDYHTAQRCSYKRNVESYNNASLGGRRKNSFNFLPRFHKPNIIYTALFPVSLFTLCCD